MLNIFLNSNASLYKFRLFLVGLHFHSLSYGSYSIIAIFLSFIFTCILIILCCFSKV